MSIKFREKLLLAGIESVYGVEEALNGSNAILAKDLEFTPLESNSIERGLEKPYLGAEEKIVSGEHVTISFKVELQGSGVAGTAPACGTLLRAAGFAETVTASTMVEYDLAATNYESATFFFFIGNNLHKAVGARGNVSLEMEAGIPYLAFEFTALYVAPVTGAAPTPDWSAWQKPTPTGEGRTSNFTLQGYSAKPHKLDIDVGQAVEYIETLTAAEVMITNRQASGSVTIEAPDLATKDYFASIMTNQTGALSIQHGQTAGLICKVDAPNVQLESPNYSEANGIATLELSLIPIPTNAGNDEVKFTFE
ncbi:hypothetical protein tloyanaT_13060 [Thalassotalea loyana]|uniref:Major tail protein n=1 Tax=Thalassotalea loyana TaxID=280483 RepID=A0ABQ6HCA2_9GAMM|nr:phage tail tube protein [Thalassotalea loyana]GLX85054.1 hypothetical protein tloyanaT_13060 [Thalassotalea loyana]